MSEDEREPEVPRIAMPNVTLIMEAGSQRQLLWIDGYMPLPVGARVQLGKFADREPPSDAIVTGIRLWGLCHQVTAPLSSSTSCGLSRAE